MATANPPRRRKRAPRRRQNVDATVIDRDIAHQRKIADTIGDVGIDPDGVGFVRLWWAFPRPKGGFPSAEEATAIYSAELQQARAIRRAMGRKAEGFDLNFTVNLEPSWAFVWTAQNAKGLKRLVARALKLSGITLQVDVQHAGDYPPNGPQPAKRGGRSGEKKL